MVAVANGTVFADNAGGDIRSKRASDWLTPAQVLVSLQTRWTAVHLRWYDGQTRLMELASDTAVWFHTGKPAVPIYWVLIRDPQGKYDTLCLLCTDQSVSPSQIAEWFVLRWQLEIAYG